MKAQPSHNHDGVTLELDRRDDPLMEAATRTATSPFRLKRILVPIDFSDCSKKALAYALPLAKANKATITLLHVTSLSYGAGEYNGIDFAQIESDAKEAGESQLRELASDAMHGEAATDTMVRIGYAANEIIDVAASLPADMIVISTHGRTGLKHVLLGSVAEHVVQCAPCPVLVVREHEREILAV